MAATRLMPIHIGKGGSIAKSLTRAINYSTDPEKTADSEFISSYECDPRTADNEFLLSKRQYFMNTGRSQGDRDIIAYHTRQSFKPGEITPEEANRIGYELAMRFTKGRHAFIVATHTDRHHIHNHIILNSTTLDCTRKFRNFWGSAFSLRRLSDTLCLENGLSIIENPKPSRGHYGSWMEQQGEAKPMTQRDTLKELLDKAVADANSPDEFFAAMKVADCEIKQGKHLAFRLKGQKRFIRCTSLGDGYSEQEIFQRISGQKQSAKINMPVDIQAAIQAGKGPGYERWAKLFNLKSAAKTLLFLQETGLNDYATLESKSREASERFSRLSAQIKALESGLKANADLQKNINNYVKTHTVYQEYRKSGYSKNYRSEHESEIILHQAAKKAFDALGVDKLATPSSLKEEYARLSSEKKTAYKDYAKARDEMKNLLTAKATVDALLKTAEQNPKINPKKSAAIMLPD